MAKQKAVKQPGVCKRERHGRTYFFAQIGNKQVGLGCNRSEAITTYDRLKAEHAEHANLASQVHAAATKPAEVKPIEPKPVLTVRAILFGFLQWCEKNRAPGTFKFYLRAIASDAAESQGYVSFDEYLTKHGKAELPATELDPSDVQSWVDDHFSETSPTYQHNQIRSVQRAYSWAASSDGQRLISVSPIEDLTKPDQTPRRTFVNNAQWEAIRANATGNFRDLLIALHETGARPAEVRAVEARHFDQATRKWFFEKPIKKTNGKQRARIVCLTDPVLAICERLAAKHPTGALFRNERGEPWTKNALVLHCNRLSKKLGIPFTAYSFRHSFATSKLLANHSAAAIAEAMGHASPDMVLKQYNQARQCPSEIRDVYGINRPAGAA